MPADFYLGIIIYISDRWQNPNRDACDMHENFRKKGRKESQPKSKSCGANGIKEEKEKKGWDHP